MNEHSHVRIESPALSADSVHLIEVSGRETLSQLFELHAQPVTTDPGGPDVDALIGAPAVLVFERAGAEVRRLGGLVAGIRDSMHEETGRMVYDLWFAPRAFRMGLVETYEIFMDISVPDIVKKKLERAGLVENTDFEFRLTAAYPPREFVVQYKETDLAFVSRLLEHLGVTFFFEHKEGVDVFVLADNNSAFAPAVTGREVPFRSRGERLGVFSLESQTRMTPAHYVVKDYNYRTPQVALQASAPTEKGDGGLVMEYGAHFKSPDEGAQIAKIRAEELNAGRTVLDGKSDRHGFSAGAMFLLEEHPRGDVELLLTEVSHRAATTALGMGKEDVRDYENTFRAIPYKTPFRPPRVTPKPRIHGVITGVIDAAAKGPYAELDAEGRYRVRFLFDAGSAGDGQASRLCRMAQPHGGGGYGMHFPLRSGVEVILTFVEGDPDRPIILGVVPNPQTPSPVTGGNGTRNIIRTGGGNEINIDDTAGGERIKLSTPFSKSSIQIGHKNCPEDGIAACTDDHTSTNAKRSVNTLTPAFSVAGDVFNVLSANDITHYCTNLVNLVALTNAGLGALGNAADALKSGLLGEQEDWAKTAEEVAANEEVHAIEKKEELEKARAEADPTLAPLEKEKQQKEEQRRAAQRELDQKKKRLESKKKELSAKEATLAKKKEAQPPPPSRNVFDVFGVAPPAPPPDPAIALLQSEISTLQKEIPPLEAEIKALEAEVAALTTDIGALAPKIATAREKIQKLEDELAAIEAGAVDLKKEAKERKDKSEAGLDYKINEAIDDYVKTVGTGLLSSVGAYAGFAAQNAADLRAKNIVLGANVGSKRGRLPTTVELVDGSPKFTGGGSKNASLVAGQNLLVGSNKRATIFSSYSTAVLSSFYTTVKGADIEVSGHKSALISSQKLIDITSKKDVKVVAEEVNVDVLAKAGSAFVTAAQEVKLKAGDDKAATFASLTGTKFTMDVEKEACLLGATRTLFEVKLKEGDIFLKAHGEKSSVSLAKEEVSVLHEGWGMKIKPKSVEIGPQEGEKCKLTLTDKSAEMGNGTAAVVVGQDKKHGHGVFIRLDTGKYVEITRKGINMVGPKLNLL